MLRKIVAAVLVLAVPAGASAGPLQALARSRGDAPIRSAIENAGARIAAEQREEGGSRRRLWTSLALIAGGGVLGTLSLAEIGDDESGPDDGEDLNGSDDGEDSDGWGSKALLGGGIASAALGGVLLMMGGKKRGPMATPVVTPVVTMKRGGFAIRHTIAF